MTPWPGGWTPWRGGALKLKRVRPSIVDSTGQPGEILSISPLIIATGEGALELIEVQAPGKKPVNGADFANGARLKSGELPWPS